MGVAERTTHERRPTSPPAGGSSKKQPGYVIVTCSYTPNSAGIGCLYRLCDRLNGLGFPSYMSGGQETAAHLNAPLIGAEAAAQLCARGYTAIYPETITGNPLQAFSVVRWVLNRPGLLGGDEIYDDSEHVFYYSDVFLPYIQNRIAGKLYMPTIDEQIFYCDEASTGLAQRSLECFYIGKSAWQEGLIDRSRVYEITRDLPAKKELGKLLRASRVLYCFDNSTILTYEALLCGCPVVVIPDGTQSRNDYQALELGMDGIAWGLEERADKPVDVAGLRARYAEVEREFERQLASMIELTQQSVASLAGGPAICRSITNTEVPWSKRAFIALKTGLETTRMAGRTVERTLRRGRKRLVQRLLPRRRPAQESLADLRHFYCEDPDLSKRSLDCAYFGRAALHAALSNSKEVFEIVPDTPTGQLATLLRATRTLYTVSSETTLIQKARRCGCRIELLNLGRDSSRHAA